MVRGSLPGWSAVIAAGISGRSTLTIAEYTSSKGPVRASVRSTRSPFDVVAISVGTSGAQTIASETSCCWVSVLARTLKVNAALGATTW